MTDSLNGLFLLLGTCEISEWSDWSICTSNQENCGKGEQNRTRSVGIECPATDEILTIQTKDCYNGDCRECLCLFLFAFKTVYNKLLHQIIASML